MVENWWWYGLGVGFVTVNFGSTPVCSGRCEGPTFGLRLDPEESPCPDVPLLSTEHSSSVASFVSLGGRGLRGKVPVGLYRLCENIHPSRRTGALSVYT